MITRIEAIQNWYGSVTHQMNHVRVSSTALLSSCLLYVDGRLSSYNPPRVSPLSSLLFSTF
ncbi:hypothetical protein GYMLUDRAFT_48727 [Collybiopsis luxurians FD-317 M1]|uniref:Uncharacterized protein n=1 Tax=Collybiopsis luxurians FD-317 M1 TaxID=944289 RepID=A0A0D0BHT4_9AGAR|nr:hypothetical protein GYMLUDRAFT_48727 [Collybiopsis luxurians FD-317 M1]